MTKLSKAALAGLLAVMFTTQAAAADEPNYQFLEGFLLDYDDITQDGSPSGGARVAIGFPFAQGRFTRSALEVGLFADGIERHPVASGNQIGLMLDLMQAFELGAVDPFLLAGVGLVQEPKVSSSSGFFPAIEAGIGALFSTADGVNLRASIAAQEVFNDELASGQDAFIDYRFNIGVVAPFGSVEPAPAKAPVDGDGDGVPDSADRCPSQPAATADGCPTPVAPAAPPSDTDGDGIDDSKDECPGTLEGLKVDASGCIAAATAQKIVLKGVTFLPNSAELTPDAKKVLDEAYDALAGQAGLKVELGGHTDSSGDDKLNLSLSQRRADSVKKYLTGKGIAAERLVAKGYGEAQPIADNKTKAGRTENRRVELKILN